MSNPFLSEIRIMAFNFAPRGWAMCNGQILPINQNQALFSLMGTTYGGNGTTTFALPNLQGRVPLHFGSGFAQGQQAGEATHTLLVSELPAHLHPVHVGTATTGGSASPATRYLGGGNNVYAAGPPDTALRPDAIGLNGGSQPHENRQPYLTLNFCIALQGIFPSRN